MRAMLSETPGGPESLKLVEIPSKPLGKGQVRVAVKAAGVNFPDTLIIADKYQFKPPRPFAPGHEIAGDITEVVEEHFGVGAGKLITLLYFFAIFPILLVYSVALTNTLGSFMEHQLHMAPPPRAILSLVLILGLMALCALLLLRRQPDTVSWPPLRTLRHLAIMVAALAG